MTSIKTLCRGSNCKYDLYILHDAQNVEVIYLNCGVEKKVDLIIASCGFNGFISDTLTFSCPDSSTCGTLHPFAIRPQVHRSRVGLLTGREREKCHIA